MSKVLSQREISPTLKLSECVDGFWLYDTTRGMNLAMRSRTDEIALVECITYYQRRLKGVETAYGQLKEQVDEFVSQFTEEEE